MEKSLETVKVSKESERLESISGVLIAIIAAIMGISGLYNSNLDEEMTHARNQHNNYFGWYQSKGVKQSLKESELSTLEALLIGNPSLKLEDLISKTKKEIARYKLEKNEIFKGSKNIPKTEWAQDLYGKMGLIIGVQEWEEKAEKLQKATNIMDIGPVFYQIALVLGAVCVVIYDNPKLQKAFVIFMCLCAIIGLYFSIKGYFYSL